MPQRLLTSWRLRFFEYMRNSPGYPESWGDTDFNMHDGKGGSIDQLEFFYELPEIQFVDPLEPVE